MENLNIQKELNKKFKKQIIHFFFIPTTIIALYISLLHLNVFFTIGSITIGLWSCMCLIKLVFTLNRRKLQEDIRHLAESIHNNTDDLLEMQLKESNYITNNIVCPDRLKNEISKKEDWIKSLHTQLREMNEIQNALRRAKVDTLSKYIAQLFKFKKPVPQTV